MINQLAQQAHQNAKNKGFFDEPKNLGEMLCLIHSEISEALEAVRNEKYTLKSDKEESDSLLELAPIIKEDMGKWKEYFEKNIKNSFEDELADAVIRIMDLSAYMNIDLEWHIVSKMRYNMLREHKHGKKF